jgi:UDP-N-acetylmuramyl tripeptide synthase
LAARLHGSGGSALPGLVIEKIQPDFLTQIFLSIPVVVISGTNGKTTTAKVVAELLTDYGLRVFTNKTGSNFTRGIASAVLNELQGGNFPFDIAVLELDEAHAVHFVNKISPDYALLLNVLRDQLDRYGEIDTTARFLQTVAEKTQKVVVLNRDDPLISQINLSKFPARAVYFGYSKKVEQMFPNDDELYGLKTAKTTLRADVILEDFQDNEARFNIGATSLLVPGAHNALNSAAALALVENIVGDKFDAAKSLRTLSAVKPAFGRGETVTINGKNVGLILVKNPSGFRIALASQNNLSASTMIAINDEYADGRDVSWLWDVDFSSLKNVAVVAGTRAYDMALRLQYDDLKATFVEPNLRKSLTKFLTVSNQNLQIYCTYTAMLKIRKYLSNLTKMEKVL